MPSVAKDFPCTVAFYCDKILDISKITLAEKRMHLISCAKNSRYFYFGRGSNIVFQCISFLQYSEYILTLFRPGGGILSARTLDVYNFFNEQAKATKLSDFT